MRASALLAILFCMSAEPLNAQTPTQLQRLDRAAINFLTTGYACQILGFRNDGLDGNVFLNGVTRRAYMRAGMYGNRYADHIQLIQRRAHDAATPEMVETLRQRSETEYGERLISHRAWVGYNESVQQAETERRMAVEDARYALNSSWGGRRARETYARALTDANEAYAQAVAGARARYGDAMAHSNGPILKPDGQPFEGNAQTLFCGNELVRNLNEQLDSEALRIFRTFSYERRDLLDAMVDLDQFR